ncbi:hypothetical protein [Streptomyces sp. NPDC101206]|uniref:hypothetical protein n=1 Tax=Streptomyces sp. NPDC101206 TaxID=3366128 RepID=UPI003821CFF6
MNGEVAPFVLPGPPLVRNTLAGWDAYRRTRKSFAPAPLLDRDAWQALSRRRRQIHDLHRAATHANLPVLSTPMSRAVGKLLTSRIETNALKQQPTTRAGVMVTGGGYQGKTESVCEIIATFEDRWRELLGHVNPEALAGTRDLHAPVAYVQTPVTAKPKSLCKAIRRWSPTSVFAHVGAAGPTRELRVPPQLIMKDELVHLSHRCAATLASRCDLR